MIVDIDINPIRNTLAELPSSSCKTPQRSFLNLKKIAKVDKAPCKMELMRRETDNYKKARPVFLHPLLFSILRLQRSEMKLKLIYHDDEPFTYYIS